MSLNHLKVTQAGLVSLLTTIVGQLVAFVPAFGPDKQILISAGSSLIAAGFLVANSVHHLADSNVSAKDVEQGAINAARTEVGKINFDALVQSAVSSQSIPDLEGKVRAAAQAEVQRLLSQLSQPPAPAQPSAVSSTVPPRV